MMMNHNRANNQELLVLLQTLQHTWIIILTPHPFTLILGDTWRRLWDVARVRVCLFSFESLENQAHTHCNYSRPGCSLGWYSVSYWEWCFPQHQTPHGISLKAKKYGGICSPAAFWDRQRTFYSILPPDTRIRAWWPLSSPRGLSGLIFCKYYSLITFPPGRRAGASSWWARPWHWCLYKNYGINLRQRMIITAKSPTVRARHLGKLRHSWSMLEAPTKVDTNWRSIWWLLVRESSYLLQSFIVPTPYSFLIHPYRHHGQTQLGMR